MARRRRIWFCCAAPRRCGQRLTRCPRSASPGWVGPVVLMTCGAYTLHLCRQVGSSRRCATSFTHADAAPDDRRRVIFRRALSLSQHVCYAAAWRAAAASTTPKPTGCRNPQPTQLRGARSPFQRWQSRAWATAWLTHVLSAPSASSSRRRSKSTQPRDTICPQRIQLGLFPKLCLFVRKNKQTCADCHTLFLTCVAVS